MSCGRPLFSGNNSIEAHKEFSLCEDCLSDIAWTTGRLCKKCGTPLAPENPKELCRDCVSETHLFSRGFACTSYSGRAAEIVRDMKYRGKAYFADALAAIMAQKFFSMASAESGELPSYDFLVAVPMHENKKSERGYNQAELLADGLSRRIGIPYFKGALVRIRETAVMSSLDRNSRLLNLSGSIEIAEGAAPLLKDARILLIDDVYTTGATADACSAPLLAAGIPAPDIFTFAIGTDGKRRND